MIKEKMRGADALLFGPGIGRGEDTVEILREILKFSQIPIILDADGLYALSKDNGSIYRIADVIWIFTPHENGISAHLRAATGRRFAKNEGLEAFRKKFAAEFGVTMVLAGAKL